MVASGGWEAIDETESCCNVRRDLLSPYCASLGYSGNTKRFPEQIRASFRGTRRFREGSPAKETEPAATWASQEVC